MCRDFQNEFHYFKNIQIFIIFTYSNAKKKNLILNLKQAYSPLSTSYNDINLYPLYWEYIITEELFWIWITWEVKKKILCERKLKMVDFDVARIGNKKHKLKLQLYMQHDSLKAG